MARARHIGTGFPRPLTRRTTRARLAGAVLLAFSLRALIPLGFMPAGDGTLSLMICPGGLPAWLLPDRDTDPGMAMSGRMPMPQQHPGRGHGQSLMDEGYCAFTTGFSSAPPPLLLAAIFLLLSFVAVAAVRVLAPAGIRLVHLPQARAPPAPR
ncbi:MAG TPA: DUF2946 family protein [Steroidobacteraceae bacterium]|jgi:hypothetical protein